MEGHDGHVSILKEQNMNKNRELTERLLTVKDLQEILGFSRSTIWKLRKQKVLPNRVKVGGKACWFLSDISKYIESLKENNGGSND